MCLRPPLESFSFSESALREEVRSLELACVTAIPDPGRSSRLPFRRCLVLRLNNCVPLLPFGATD
jgi:hypothetical protein